MVLSIADYVEMLLFETVHQCKTRVIPLNNKAIETTTMTTEVSADFRTCRSGYTIPPPMSTQYEHPEKAVAVSEHVSRFNM